MKSIPIPSNQHYLKCLLEKLNSFIRRLRWKAYFFDHHDEHAQNEDNNNYGFKSERTPPQINDLIDFEADLYRMARSVSFRKVSNPFQNKLACDVKTINSSPDLFVPADIGILEHRDQQLILAIYVRRATAKIASKVIRSFEIFCLKVKCILVMV